MNDSPHPRRAWAPVDAAGLPDDLILFDGVCVLCAGWVRFVIGRDRARRFRFVSIQSPFGRDMAIRLGIDPDAPQTNAVVCRGRVWFKGDSVLRVLEHFPAWRPLLLFGFLPRTLRDWIYDRIALNRYALFGRSQDCLVPDPALAGRFVDGTGRDS